MATAGEELVTLFVSVGLSEQKARETTRNANLSKKLEQIANEAIKRGYSLTENGKLYYHLASKLKPQHDKHLILLVDYISQKKLNSVDRLDMALDFLLSNSVEDEIPDLEALDVYCGIGVEYTAEEIKETVREIVNELRDELRAKKCNKSALIRAAQAKLKWADRKSVADEANAQIEKLLSEIATSKSELCIEETKTFNTGDPTNGGEVKEDSGVNIIDVMKRLNFHKPGENYKTDGYIITENTERLMKEHLAITGGKVRTRFPPEPNGILHIGHAKAININFGYATAHGGVCFLRYDDTNPEKEEEKFFTGIREMVEWLGYRPYKVTHSSDYFDQLYEWAVRLIKKGLAYVCHQKQEEMKGFSPPPSPWRDRSIEKNLRLFRNMKSGVFAEGEATLRMKVTLEEGKQDPVAYRIKYLPHPRTGDKWCIYPTYDYTHCLCDSIEHITHSLCTKEFQSRRSAYYWLCNALDLYCPVQWEYGRLNMNYTVVSKRKIQKLIECGIVQHWDDPRLFTLTALRRRGFPPEAINRFCAKMGVTGAQTIVDPQMLESDVRYVLNETASRTMVVTEPLKVRIVNYKALNRSTNIEVPDFPVDTSKGHHTIEFGETVYIELSDFREEADKSYRRLSLDQSVGLRYAGVVIKVQSVKRDPETVLLATAESVTASNKPKAFIHWVSDPVQVQLRLYDKLFMHKNPENAEEVKTGYLSDVNPHSLIKLTGFADKSLLQQCKVSTTFQFERVGFFCLDKDSTDSHPVFNRTVTLKEDSSKS